MKISPPTVKGNKKQMPSAGCNLSLVIRRWCSEEQQCSCQVTRRLHQPPLQLTGRHMNAPPTPPRRPPELFLVPRLRTSPDSTHGAVNNSCMCKQALKVAWKSDTAMGWALRLGFIHQLSQRPSVEAERCTNQRYVKRWVTWWCVTWEESPVVMKPQSDDPTVHKYQVDGDLLSLLVFREFKEKKSHLTLKHGGLSEQHRERQSAVNGSCSFTVSC